MREGNGNVNGKRGRLLQNKLYPYPTATDIMPRYYIQNYSYTNNPALAVRVRVGLLRHTFVGTMSLAGSTSLVLRCSDEVI